MSNQETSSVTSVRIPIAIIACVFSVLAFLLSVFVWYQVAVVSKLEKRGESSVVSDHSEQLKNLKYRLDSVDKDVEKQKSGLFALDKQFEQRLLTETTQRTDDLSQFKEEFEQLSAGLEKVYEDLGRSVDIWALEEVEQLMVLANQQISLTGNINLASRALALADARLAEIGDPALLLVRKQITLERGKLERLGERDFVGIILNVIAIQDRIESLPLVDDSLLQSWPKSQSVLDKSPGSENSLETFSKEFLNDLKSLVSIKKVDDTQLPKLEPLQRFLIQENLRLKLDLAQQAFYREEYGVFTKNIEFSKLWLERYFDVSSNVVEEVSSELEELTDLKFMTSLPDLSRSLELLRGKINERVAK